MVVTAAGPALAAKPVGSNCGDDTQFITTDENLNRTGAVHGCGEEINTTHVGKGNCGSKDGTPFAPQGKEIGVLHSCGEPLRGAHRGIRVGD